MDLELKDIVKDRVANLINKGEKFYTYEIELNDGVKFQFNIDITDKADVGEEAVFNDSEKAIMLMRWIRRSLKENSYTIA